VSEVANGVTSDHHIHVCLCDQEQADDAMRLIRDTTALLILQIRRKVKMPKTQDDGVLAPTD
jgi:hypothetical protein